MIKSPVFLLLLNVILYIYGAILRMYVIYLKYVIYCDLATVFQTEISSSDESNMQCDKIRTQHARMSKPSPYFLRFTTE